MKIKGLRVDPSFLYKAFSGSEFGKGTDRAVEVVVEDCFNLGVNTIFVFAHSAHPTAGGAMWDTGDPQFATENGHGVGDFLPKLVDKAAERGIGVVASFWMTNYPRRSAVRERWRAKTRAGNDYRPFGEKFGRLSAHEPEFGDWFDALLENCVRNTPGLRGLEALEGAVAVGGETGLGMPDYRLTVPKPRKKDPEDPAWLRARAEAMTRLHGRLFSVASRHGLESFYVQDLGARGIEGALAPFEDYAALTGFDWPGIAAQGADFANLSAIWQQRYAEAPGAGFSPAWTAKAVAHFRDRFAQVNTTKVLAHVEITPWPPENPVIRPTTVQFRDALQGALDAGEGTTIYEYAMARRLSKLVPPLQPFFGAIRSVYKPGV